MPRIAITSRRCADTWENSYRLASEVVGTVTRCRRTSTEKRLGGAEPGCGGDASAGGQESAPSLPRSCTPRQLTMCSE
jgi:hypothetical protein